MAAIDQFMPLYIGDYMKDTRHLSAAESGAYILLLMQAWTRGGALPLDEDRLRAISSMTPREWRHSRETILSFFVEVDGAFRNRRLDRELAKRDAIVTQRKTAAAASVRKRKKKQDQQPDPNGGTNGKATEGSTGSQPATATATREGIQRQSQSPDPRPRAPLDLDANGRQVRHLNPARDMPREAWLHLADRNPDGSPKVEVDREWRVEEKVWRTRPETVGEPICGGSYIRGAADAVCEAAKITDPSWRGDWRPLVEWLRADIDLHDVILPAIRKVASRPGYEPVASLRYFDQPVRMRARERAA